MEKVTITFEMELINGVEVFRVKGGIVNSDNTTTCNTLVDGLKALSSHVINEYKTFSKGC